jgi:hypothetical protein
VLPVVPEEMAKPFLDKVFGKTITGKRTFNLKRSIK